MAQSGHDDSKRAPKNDAMLRIFGDMPKATQQIWRNSQHLGSVEMIVIPTPGLWHGEMPPSLQGEKLYWSTCWGGRGFFFCFAADWYHTPILFQKGSVYIYICIMYIYISWIVNLLRFLFSKDKLSRFGLNIYMIQNSDTYSLFLFKRQCINPVIMSIKAKLERILQGIAGCGTQEDAAEILAVFGQLINEGGYKALWSYVRKMQGKQKDLVFWDVLYVTGVWISPSIYVIPMCDVSKLHSVSLPTFPEDSWSP